MDFYIRVLKMAKSGDRIVYTGETKHVMDEDISALMEAELIEGKFYTVVSVDTSYGYYLLLGIKFWCFWESFVIDYGEYLTLRYGFK